MAIGGYRFGFGIDQHVFSDTEKPLVLGGVEFGEEFRLVGHSDGDVLCHAICDSLLGALGLGDIGQWFPSSDKSLKAIKSTQLLEKVVDSVHKSGYKINQLDVTLFGSRPRIEEKRLAIARSVSEITLSPVSLKATDPETNESYLRCYALSVLVPKD